VVAAEHPGAEVRPRRASLGLEGAEVEDLSAADRSVIGARRLGDGGSAQPAPTPRGGLLRHTDLAWLDQARRGRDRSSRAWLAGKRDADAERDVIAEVSASVPASVFSSVRRQGDTRRAHATQGGRTAAWLAPAFGIGLARRIPGSPRRAAAVTPAERRDGGRPGQTERREPIKRSSAARGRTRWTESMRSTKRPPPAVPDAGALHDETDTLLAKRVDIPRRLRHADSLKESQCRRSA